MRQSANSKTIHWPSGGASEAAGLDSLARRRPWATELGVEKDECYSQWPGGGWQSIVRTEVHPVNCGRLGTERKLS